MIRPLRQIFTAMRGRISPQEKRFPWLLNYPDSVQWDAEIIPRPLPDLLARAARDFPTNTAIDFLDYTLTYKELYDQARSMATGLQLRGLKKGDRVGLFLPNSPHFVISYYAILLAGGVVVNFNPLYAARDITHQIRDSGVKIMITFALESLLGKLEACRDEVSIPTLIVAQFTEALPFPKNWLFPLIKFTEVMPMPAGEGYISFQDLLAEDRKYLQQADMDPEVDVAVLQYTGGTTGTPKGAMLTHANLYTNATQCSLWLTGLEDGNERMLGVLPCFHVFAMTAVMNLSIAKGLTMILHPQFNLKAVLKDIDKKKPTLMPGVPTIFSAINQVKNIKKYDLSSLKMCISGGAGLPRDVRLQFEANTGCKLVEGYGLSETSPVVAVNPLFGVNKAGSIGMPLPGTIIEVVGTEKGRRKDKVMAMGETGEICIRGPQVMKGYWNRPDETANTLRNGRLHTGDVGYMDADGYFFIVDRLKEMIISGGYNIYPRNVEEVLYDHPDVVEAAVIGVEDEHWGQRVKAFVALKQGSGESEDTLRAYCKDQLPRFAVPATIEFRDELPKTMIGKISKKDLC